MQKCLSLFVALLSAVQLLNGQQDTLCKTLSKTLPETLSKTLPEKENPFYFEASYIGEVYGNAVGGLKSIG